MLIFEVAAKIREIHRNHISAFVNSKCQNVHESKARISVHQQSWGMRVASGRGRGHLCWWTLIVNFFWDRIDRII